MHRRLIALAIAALSLAGCQQLTERWQAATGVHDFLAAVQAGDQAAFEAHIDRPALRASLRDRLNSALGAGEAKEVLGALLGSRSADSALDQMLTPESFRIIWRASRLPTDRVPTAAEISPFMIMQAPGQACVRRGLKSNRCALDFKNEGGTWKLVGVEVGGKALEKAI